MNNLRALVGKYSGEDTEEWMTTFARKWEEVGVRKGMQTGLRKGLQTGLQRGLQRGRTEGRVETLMLQMGRRFGPVGDSVRDRIAGASADQLDAWLVSVLDAASVEEMLAASPRD